jgi:ParB family chromosome partitioning protein
VSKKRGLGRGLDILLGDSLNEASVGVESTQELQYIQVECLQAGKYQPRKDIQPDALDELAASIKAQGIMQPIVIRPLASEGCFEIIAGERRWRAARQVGLDKIPCMIKDVSDDAAIAMALIENIQREDLNPMEEATALNRLKDEFGLTQQEVADVVGKSRTTITNLLRLMNLNDEVKTLLEHGDLEMGHARALLAIKGADQAEAARVVVAKSMTVRQAEGYVRALQVPSKSEVGIESEFEIRSLEKKIGGRVGAEVIIKHNAKGKGKLTIGYSNLGELDGILAHIK